MKSEIMKEKLDEIRKYGILIGNTSPVSLCNEQIRRVGWHILEILGETHPRQIQAEEARELRKLR